MVLRGHPAHHARSFSYFGAAVPGIKSIRQCGRLPKGRQVRRSRPSEERHKETRINEERRFFSRGLASARKAYPGLFGQRLLDLRLSMNTGKRFHSLSRHRIKKNRKKTSKDFAPCR
ncbi:hypothetical protein KM043_013096 [Ampulex compressa]|nr:hypothetical protein KM043_013096 [Ampulex compressa]